MITLEMLGLLMPVNGARRRARLKQKPFCYLGFCGAWSIACILAFSGVSPAFADSNPNTILPYTCGSTLYPGNGTLGGCFYTRVIRLHYNGSANGRLLATFENDATQNFGIYQSDDDGLTWTSSPIGVCSEQKNAGWFLRAQPCLFELPTSLGNLPAGTLLLAGNSETNAPTQSSEIEIYSSTNRGVTWQYRGSVDVATNSPGTGGIWEPQLLIATNGNLACLYADERQRGSGYNQMISEKASTDGGLTWGVRQSVVAIQDSVSRPGMPVTTKLPNGQYVMAFEAIGSSPNGQMRIKFSWDGINWGSGPSDYGTAVKTADGAYLGKTPFICWSPAGGSNGTLVLSGQTLIDGQNSDRQMLINTSLGQGNWTMMPSPVQWQGCSGTDRGGYSTGLINTSDGLGIIQLASSGISSTTCAIKYGRQSLVLPGSTFTEIINQNSGLAVDIPGNTNSHGVILQQWTPGGGQAQRWTFNSVGNNTWTIQNPFNNLVWDDYGWNTNAGAFVDQWDNTGAAVQQWKLRPNGDGYWKFINVNSSLLLAVNGASVTPGASLTQWMDNGTSDHNWLLSQIGAKPTGFSATNTGSGEVTLSWDASPGAVSYNVKRSASSGSEVIIGNITSTSYVDSGLVNGQTYFYEVSVVGAGGEGFDSQEVSILAGYIFEASTGAAQGTDWNQGSQWVGGAVPLAGIGYYVFTNTTGSPGLGNYYGVNFGAGRLRTPADASASTFLGNRVIVPSGAELLMKETPGGSASANIIFREYNNGPSSGMYPMVRLSPNPSGPGTVTLNGTITADIDSYLAVDYASTNLTLKIASTVSGAATITLVSSAVNIFSNTKTNFVTGNWSGFSGALAIGNTTIGGVAELNHSASNTNMALTMPNTNSVLILDKTIRVASFQIGSRFVAAGTYTPAQLTALGYGGKFSGIGSLVVSHSSNAVSLPLGPKVNGVIDGANLRISWAVDLKDWRLQMQTNGLGTNWIDVPTQTNEIIVPINAQNSSVFFRLVYP